MRLFRNGKTLRQKVWERELDIYGRVRKEFTSDEVKDRRCGFMPFLYQGQYYDKETELAYNRFRYYDPNSGNYISQDPIRLSGNNPNLYAYVKDSNRWVDVFGLDGNFLFRGTTEGYLGGRATDFEKEVGINMLPNDLSKLSSLQIPAKDATSILREMGYNIPSNPSLDQLSSIFKELEAMDDKKINDFVDKAKKNCK